ncbi:hypothetical protein WUBG_04735 [Wuchereria bancrofti]|uniref:Uncharacterized protein n=1 Tax=Wuchereria bancrofti TaxID=6293 RepID=J9BB35_WUCBA|nr:hypothetical protein WUBG_04735 [Wuchereria bancrofti]
MSTSERPLVLTRSTTHRQQRLSTELAIRTSSGICSASLKYTKTWPRNFLLNFTFEMTILKSKLSISSKKQFFARIDFYIESSGPLPSSTHATTATTKSDSVTFQKPFSNFIDIIVATFTDIFLPALVKLAFTSLSLEYLLLKLRANISYIHR